MTGLEVLCATWVSGELPETPYHVPGDPYECFPCLVDVNKNTAVVDQAWATDNTHIPLQKGSYLLVPIMYLFYRNMLSWRLTTSLDTEFCVEAVELPL